MTQNENQYQILHFDSSCKMLTKMLPMNVVLIGKRNQFLSWDHFSMKTIMELSIEHNKLDSFICIICQRHKWNKTWNTFLNNMTTFNIFRRGTLPNFRQCNPSGKGYKPWRNISRMPKDIKREEIKIYKVSL